MNTEKITVLGKTFNSEEERREYFRNELRKHLPELKKMEGFPIGEDEDIINLSDPPYYTACPNPWLNDFIAEWEEEKKQLEKEGKRSADFNVDEPYTKNITESVNNEIYRAHSYHTKVPHPAICRLLLHYTQPGDVFIDSFAGTGMAGVAGRKCDGLDPELKKRFTYEFNEIENVLIGERRAILNDLSPLAFHISKTFNTNYNVLELKNVLKIFRDKLSKNIAPLYRTKYHEKDIPINYLVWSEILLCKSCSQELIYHDLTTDYENKKFTDILVCPKCKTKQKRTEAVALKETVFDRYLNTTVEQLKYVPVHINFTAEKKRRTKLPNENDIDLASFDDPNKNDKYVPTNPITIGDKSSDPFRVGVKNIHQFYTPRIRFFIKSYLHLANTKEFENHTDFFLFILTAILPKLNRMNRYMPKHGSRALVGPMANTLYIPPMYVENNPLDQFDFQSKKIINAFKFEHSKNVGQVGSATKIENLKNDSVDYVFVDPPFGANIMYSELNQLTENWLSVKTNNKVEAIENKSQKKGKLDYQNLMINSFKELYRVLKPDKYMTVQFSNTSAAIWNTIQNAINQAEFVISNIITNDNKRGGLHSMLGPTAVKQNLIINCYKPANKLVEKFNGNTLEKNSIWDFIEHHLNHLPVHLAFNNSTSSIIERNPKILYDTLLKFYFQKGKIPIDAVPFQQGLRERFVETDGMFFTSEQAAEYDKKKAEHPEFVQLSLLVASEQDGVLWLKNKLTEQPMTYQDIQPEWMQALSGLRKGDILPELKVLLEENFLKDEEGRWYQPDPENEIHIEQLRTKRLLKEFDKYRQDAANLRTKRIKEVRVEALRTGFKHCYQEKDFKAIVEVGNKIPENLLMEDEVLLQFYDIAGNKF
jgi:DNA modification methylase